MKQEAWRDEVPTGKMQQEAMSGFQATNREYKMTLHYERTLGRLEGKLDHMIESQAHLGCKWEKMAGEFAALLRRQDAQTHELIRVKQRLDEMSEPAREFGRWRERAVGALMLLSLGGALIGGSAVAFWQKFSALLR